MTRTAVLSGSSGSSRIPMPQFRSKENERNDLSDPMKKSRSDEIQTEYQKKMMKEKENKMVKLYEHGQHRALQRVNTRGKVREFFKESRGYDLNDPSLHRKFQELNNDSQTSYSGYSNIPTYQYNNHYNNNEFQLDNKSSVSRYSNGSLPSSSRSTPHFNKNSRGRDKSSPLEPIHKIDKSDDFTNGFSHIPPINQQENDNNSNIKKRPVKKTQSFTSKQGADQMNNSYGSDALSNSLRQSHGKMSEFQKWKMQNQNGGGNSAGSGSSGPASGNNSFRSSQNGNHNEAPHMSELLKRKEHELQARIDAEKLEMEKMRKQIAAEEEERRKEEEMDRKKAAADEKKKRQEELAQKKKELEQERIRQKAEEKKRKDSEAEMKKDLERARKQNEQEAKQRKQAAPKKVVPPKKAPTTKSSYDDDEEYVLPDAQVDFYANAINEDDAFGGSVKMATCSICSRSFAADRLAKHQVICKKSAAAAQKRKTFDSSKMRVEGTEQAKFHQKGSKAAAKTQMAKPKKDWRKQHEDFIESIRYAKKVGDMEARGVAAKDLPPPPKSDYSDYVQCQYCKKKFNSQVAERHIPKCKDMRHNKTGKR